MHKNAIANGTIQANQYAAEGTIEGSSDFAKSLNMMKTPVIDNKGDSKHAASFGSTDNIGK